LTGRGPRANNERVPIAFFARQWERTCRECGYTWLVPRSIARRGIRGISAMSAMGATRGAWASNSSLGGMRSGIAGRAELMEQFRICAKCGVDDFTQRPYRRGETAPRAAPQP
jgi:predicted nucleic-acid-binding Zn-ribbon protein